MRGRRRSGGGGSKNGETVVVVVVVRGWWWGRGVGVGLMAVSKCKTFLGLRTQNSIRVQRDVHKHKKGLEKCLKNDCAAPSDLSPHAVVISVVGNWKFTVGQGTSRALRHCPRPAKNGPPQICIVHSQDACLFFFFEFSGFKFFF